MSQSARALARLNNPRGSTDHWFTPMDLWTAWNREHRFTLDVAAHHEAPVSCEIGRFFTIEDDGLRQPWDGEHVWCNPPFSDIAPWVEKAHDVMHTPGRGRVVMLIPANRTEQGWWQRYVEPWRDRGACGGVSLEARFLPRRFRFGFPGDPTGASGSSPTFGCVLLTWMRDGR